jgi:arylsulfatase A-like enzyme
MMADDLGYHDLSSFGSERQDTPALDQMAQEGLRLTSFYAGASVCTPSRMALLSGSYPTRLGWQGGVLGYGMRPNTGLSQDVYTVAEAFKAGGYRTAMVGKWHVGDRDLRPEHQGFDETFYILASNNMSRDLFRNGERIEEDFSNRHLSEAFTEEVIRQISVESEQPFFIYVPFTAPHFPAEAHPDWIDHSDNKAYGDVVEELDHRVGQILASLKANGIDNQTLVIFISDNGPEGGQREFASALPYSGGKWTAREGGLRVPAIMRWPEVLWPGQETDAIVSAMDLYPTLAHACNIDLNIPEDAQKLDGVNVWGSLTGNDLRQSRDHLLYWHGQGEPAAIRQGNWKLFFGGGKGDPDVADGPALFNLSEDPQESTDLSEQHPAVVEDLLELAREQLAEIYEHDMPIGVWEGAERSAEDAEPTERWGRWLK